ncbi:MAG: hypothetical protein EOO39_29985 [Cytophagaceae bacterium]|nr:MAG: hypothetical protein EOO39_29985 [Cytophagaceae bacterium]
MEDPLLTLGFCKTHLLAGQSNQHCNGTKTPVPALFLLVTASGQDGSPQAITSRLQSLRFGPGVT